MHTVKTAMHANAMLSVAVVIANPADGPGQEPRYMLMCEYSFITAQEIQNPSISSHPSYAITISSW